jgi:hypothetical protein
VNRHPSKDRIEFFDFHPSRSILFIFGGNVPRSTRLTGFLMLGAFQYHLYPISFFCHPKLNLSGLFYQSLRPRFLDTSGDAPFIDNLQRLGGNLERYPTVFLGKVKTLFGQVYVKPSSGLVNGERYIVTEHRPLSRNLTDF